MTGIREDILISLDLETTGTRATADHIIEVGAVKFRGDDQIDTFSELVNPELSGEVQSYFSDRGITFSENSSKVFSTNNPEFDEWRNIPSTPQHIVGKGGGAIIFFLTWHIGNLW